MDQDVLGDEVNRLTLAVLTRRAQSAALPIPIQNPALLPLSSLDPEVLERLVAEMVSRRDNLGVQFYGRRGQKQYGLDIVERERDLRRSLYQVKRYLTLTAALLRDAVVDYAGAPRKADYQGEPRRFDPYRFVVVTSAPLDADTATVDELARVQDEYSGDLVIEVWGAEELSRKLRDMPNLVFALFGAQWAKAYCGFDEALATPTTPTALGFVEDPVSVLNLDAFKADAEATEADGKAQEAAHLFGLLADGLRDGGFPGHAVAMRWRQAKALQAGGEQASAFEVLFRLALDQVLAGWSNEVKSLLRELEKLSGSLGDVWQGKYQSLNCVAGWYRYGSQLAVILPALRVLTGAKDPDAGLLTCLVLEQALVDSMYDWHPIQPLLVDVNSDTEAHLIELREMAAAAECPDVVVRARLRCAVADASLTLDADAQTVEAAYRPLLDDALAGRLRHARGLVAARAARAFAMAGESDRADNLHRQSILGSSEDGFYGDTRGTIRASQFLTSDRSVLRFFGPIGDLSFLPNRRRLLSGAFDPALSALDEVHDGKLSTAFGDTRRYLWESRLSGHLNEEANALTLCGDVLAEGGHLEEAVAHFVHAGAESKAVDLASKLERAVDVSRWTASRVRRRRAAAVQVIGAQVQIIPDADVPGVVDTLLDVASGVWQASWNTPRPERDALDAAARFGIRIPIVAVDRILALAEPARKASTRQGETIANLLVQTYWSVETRRQDVADALSDLLRQLNPPAHLWETVAAIPKAACGPLLPVVNTLADQGHEQAIECLAMWRHPTAAVQRRARQAGAALLRRPIGIDRTTWKIGNREEVTVEFVLALSEAEHLVDVPATELGPDQAPPVGGVLASITVAPGSASTANLPPTLPTADPTTKTTNAIPDNAALAAAGAPDDLLVAIARHLTAMTADTKDAAAQRVQAAHALRPLTRHLPGAIADELLLVLREVHREPGFSQLDLAEIESTTPMNPFMIDTDARYLPAFALLAAAETFAASCGSTEEAVDEAHRDTAREIVAATLPLLREGDPRARLIGAVTISTIASAASDFSSYAEGLLYHPDAAVRVHGVAQVSLNPQTIVTLAADPSAMVRAALANRANELPDETKTALAKDAHFEVRHSLAQAASRTSEPTNAKRS